MGVEYLRPARRQHRQAQHVQPVGDPNQSRNGGGREQFERGGERPAPRIGSVQCDVFIGMSFVTAADQMHRPLIRRSGWRQCVAARGLVALGRGSSPDQGFFGAIGSAFMVSVFIVSVLRGRTRLHRVGLLHCAGLHRVGLHGVGLHGAGLHRMRPSSWSVFMGSAFFMASARGKREREGQRDEGRRAVAKQVTWTNRPGSTGSLGAGAARRAWRGHCPSVRARSRRRLRPSRLRDRIRGISVCSR